MSFGASAKKVLLSHGQATVERGLSVNKEVESQLEGRHSS